MVTKKGNGRVICQICKKEKDASEVIPAGVLRGPVTDRIKASFPEWSPSGYICLPDLNRFRDEYVQEVIKQDKGELTELDTKL